MTTKITLSNLSSELIDSLQGPRIATVSITDSSWNILDDTAVDTGGGYLLISGSGFASGCSVLVNETPATAVTFINSTTLRVQVPARSAGTYNVQVVNANGSNTTKTNGLTYSASPIWSTGSELPLGSSGLEYSQVLSATNAVSYSLQAGSSLPTGITLASNGTLSGTTTVESNTNYSFTIIATDAEGQDTPRTFSLTMQSVIPPSSVEYMVVAGGGGTSGGGLSENAPGGGGAGGYRTGTLSVSGLTQYTITVGAGGTGGAAGANGTKGADSTFATITSAGGGSGRWLGGENGGSGGGRAGSGQHVSLGDFTINLGNVPATTPAQGNNGGYGAGTYGNNATSGGGGGGATAVGQNAPSISVGGIGGAGATNSISGTALTYATGGNGGVWNATNSGINADPNTGNGATAAGGGGTGTGGAGGSGVVIIRYSNTSSAATSTTGNPTYTMTGGYHIYKFTGSGTIEW